MADMKRVYTFGNKEAEGKTEIMKFFDAAVRYRNISASKKRFELLHVPIVIASFILVWSSFITVSSLLGSMLISYIYISVALSAFIFKSVVYLSICCGRVFDISKAASLAICSFWD